MSARARVAGEVQGVLLYGNQEGSRRHYFEGGRGGGRCSCVGGRGRVTRQELQTGIE